METTSCIKAVVLASNQYRNNKSDSNLVYLQRELDFLISVVSKESLTFFNLKQLLPTECITHTVQLLADPQIQPSLAAKCIALLSKLAQESEIRDALHDTFHVSPAVAGLIKLYGGSVVDNLTVECIHLLQKITYGKRITFQENYTEDLVKFLLKNVLNADSEITQPTLGLLANLCRNNFPIQNFIKSLSNIKAIYRSLITKLSHEDLTVIVYSLSTVTSLCIKEDLGEILYSVNNINQTFQMIFNLLVNGDAGFTRRYVVDLFIDIIKNPKIQQSLIGYSHLSVCIKQVFNLLAASTAESVSKIFDLLTGFCAVGSLRSTICKVLFDTPALQSDTECNKLLQQPLSQVSEPLFAVVQWFINAPEGQESVSLCALEFLNEMYEEFILSGWSSKMSCRLEVVLAHLVKTLKSPLEGDVLVIKRKCERITKSAQLLIALCGDDELKASVAESINTEMFSKLINYQLNNNRLAVNYSRGRDRADSDWGEAGVHVFLYSVQLMSKIKRYVAEMDKQFSAILQDSRIVPFLARGMTADSRDHVQVAVNLVGLGSAYEGFPSIVLGDAIAAINSEREQNKRQCSVDLSTVAAPNVLAPLHLQNYSNKENMFMCNTVKPRGASLSVDQDASIQLLINKMSTSLEVKDVRASEIIDVYEHKLQSMQMKESHLQDLLEAKTLALSQADRLISQNRSRKAQNEAETHHLWSLLREAEKQSESYRERWNEIVSEKEQLQQDAEHLANENQRLEENTQEYKEEQRLKLENTEQALAALNSEYTTLSEMHEMLRKHNESLKQKHEVTSKQLIALEEERKSISRQLKEKESQLHDTTKSLQRLQEKQKKSVKEVDSLEDAIDKLRGDLAKTEEVKKKMQHQVSSLELVCQQHEGELKEKDKILHDQKAKIDKHAEMVALICSMSGK